MEKTMLKTMLNVATMPFRFVIFLFGGSGENKWRPAGRYTRPDYRYIRPVTRKGHKPSAGHTLG
jgi:hypothetical protein